MSKQMKDVGGAEQLYQYLRKHFILYLMDLPLSILKSCHMPFWNDT